jgi:hypothetical protein
MTDIRELLRSATDDLVIDAPDPVGQIRRATTKRRRTWVATVAVIAAVVAAIVIPLSLTSGTGSTQPVAPSPTPMHARAVIQTWEPDDLEAAAGFGSIWGLSAAGNGNPGRSWVDQLNPATGARIHRFSIPAPTFKISVGAGRVWVIGQNAGGGGTSYISTIDPTNGQVATLRLTNPQAEPYDIAFSDGSGWVTMQLLNQVWRLTPSATGIAQSVIPVSGGPTTIAATRDGAVWVQREGPAKLTRIVRTAHGGRLGQTVGWSGSVLGAFGRNSLLASAGNGQVWEIEPAQLRNCLACAQADLMISKGQVRTAVHTSRGVFVSTTHRTYFYSDFNLNHFGNGIANASIADEGGSIAPDGNGVVIGAGDDGLIHWIPAG